MYSSIIYLAVFENQEELLRFLERREISDYNDYEMITPIRNEVKVTKNLSNHFSKSL